MKWVAKSTHFALFLFILWNAVDGQDDYGGDEKTCFSDDDVKDSALAGLGPVGDIVGGVLGGSGGLGIFSACLKCIAEYARNIDVCGYNSSWDPFAVIRQCGADTGFDQLAKKLQMLLPQVDAPLDIPEQAAHARCWQPDVGLFADSALRLAGSVIGMGNDGGGVLGSVGGGGGLGGGGGSPLG